MAAPAERRVLVTGSREYDDETALCATLDRIFGEVSEDPDGVLFLIRSEQERLGLPCGPERIAARWATGRIDQGLPVVEEVYPADWRGDCVLECTHSGRETFRGVSVCPQAGERATAKIVAAEPDTALVCLRVGTSPVRARERLRQLHKAGAGCEMVVQVQGEARGLPSDLIPRH